MAVVLQTLSARGWGWSPAMTWRRHAGRSIRGAVNFALWGLAEVAIAACDLAEVVGTVIALKLLFGLPLLWGCLVTALDTFLLLWLQKIRDAEDGGGDPGAWWSRSAVASSSRSSWPGPTRSRWCRVSGRSCRPARCSWPSGSWGPRSCRTTSTLHSALVQSRRIGDDRASKIDRPVKYNLIDSVVGA